MHDGALGMLLDQPSHQLWIARVSVLGFEERPHFGDGWFFKTPQYLQFLADRARLLDAIFADKRLSPTDKVIAFAATRFIRVKHLLTSESYRTIGEVAELRVCAPPIQSDKPCVQAASA
jgi:hypothetical protein